MFQHVCKNMTLRDGCTTLVLLWENQDTSSSQMVTLKIVCWMSEGLSHCLTQASDRLCKDHDNEGGALVAAKILTF